MLKLPLVFVLLFALFSQQAKSDDIYTFRPSSEIQSIGKYSSYYEDKTGKESFETVSKTKTFISDGKEVPSLGFSNSTFWLKVSVRNLTADTFLLLMVENPILDSVGMYYVRNGEVNATFLSESKPFRSREILNQNYVFRINIPKDSAQTMYLRINSSEQLLFPLYISDHKTFLESTSTNDLIFGLYWGIVMVMILYNLFIFFSVRDFSYVIYSLYVLAVGLTQGNLQGYTYRYLWPAFPWLEIHSSLLMPIFSGITAVLFVKSFLDAKKRAPLFDKLCNLSIFLYLACLVLCLADQLLIGQILVQCNASFACLVVILLAIKLTRENFRPAKFFLLSWIFFLSAICIFVLRNFGILPYNAFTYYVMEIGSAIEVTLLSFALADRINILQEEKEQSQALALSEAQKNELLIRDQNVTLEKKVGERTIQLRSAIEELNVTMDDLKNTQAQLVDSEKMASLGQLTAGIAHEINNPINFVTSNINPLKRDIQDVYQLLEKFESSQERMEPDFVQEINKLKKDLDIGYVKDEIDLLLKGIDEGANRTSEIIRGLKKFSRVDEQDIKEVDLNEGFESTLLLLNSRIKDHIKLDLNLGQLPSIECYAGKLNQVFMNIITNSIYAINQRYGDSKEGSLLIKTEVDPGDPKRVIIIISDNGTGMSEETVAKVFDPFFTTKPVGEGTGLGLSIVHKIITAHKGTIDVDSQLGKGTEFKITLPVRQ